MGGRSSGTPRQEGAAVLLIDTTVTPPRTEVVVVGGGFYGAPTDRNPATVERIDLTNPAAAAWDPSPIPLASPAPTSTPSSCPTGGSVVGSMPRWRAEQAYGAS
jgi:hypothetical protein